MTTGNATDPGIPQGLAGAAAPHRRIGRKGVLSRDKVLTAGIQVIDDEGLSALSMRRIADRFGVEAMSLYHYVAGRDDLLDGIIDTVFDDLHGDPDVHMRTDDWQDYLTRLAHGIRRIALTHPQVFPLIATRRPAAPWIKPPLRSLEWIGSLLGVLRRNGFGPGAAVAAYQAFASFLLGHLLLEAATISADTSPMQPHPQQHTPADLSAYPLLQNLETELTQDHAAEQFDASLTCLLDRLQNGLHYGRADCFPAVGGPDVPLTGDVVATVG